MSEFLSKPSPLSRLSQLTLLSLIDLPPAHGVVVLRVAEAGGFQLAAHHRAGALVSCQVALQSTLAVHTRPWDTTEEKKRGDIHNEFSCLLKSTFTYKHSSLPGIP